MNTFNELHRGLNSRILRAEKSEYFMLSALFLLFYITFAGIGRDIFYNPLYAIKGHYEDPIGAQLPRLRVLVCLTGALIVITSSGLNWSFSKIPYLFAPFILWAFASALWAGNEANETLRSAIQLLIAWVCLPMIIHRLGLVRCAILSLHLIAVVCIASAALAIFLPRIGVHNGLEVFQASHVGRWRGIFAHKNALGPWAALGTMLIFTFSWVSKAPRIYWWTAEACAVLCLFMSGAATALVCVVALFYIYGFLYLLRHYKLSAVLTIYLFTTGFLAAISLPAMDFVFQAIGRDTSLTGRTVIWSLALDYIGRQPWTGYGYGIIGGQDFLDHVFNLTGQPIPGPESGYLNVLIETGIIGCVLFFVPFFMAMRNAFEWMKFVTDRDRGAIEFFILILFSTLIYAISESNSLVVGGYDGIISYTGFFALMTTPKSPEGVMRGEFRLAKYRFGKMGRKRNSEAHAEI